MSICGFVGSELSAGTAGQIIIYRYKKKDAVCVLLLRLSEIGGVLGFVELGINAVGVDQLFVGAAFGDDAVGNGDDAAGRPDGG